MQSLTLPMARKLALLSQGLPAKPQRGNALSETLASIIQLGYVQIDTIATVQRAHHHTLWSRNPGYKTSLLNQLVADKSVFEYWSHAAAYLPMQDYRYSLPRKLALKEGKQNHWFQRDHKLMRDVLKRIEDEGPLMAKDFTSESKKSNGWGSKPTKQALENLYMQGDLMIADRKHFHKVYDLTERVLPNNIDVSVPTEKEYAHFLVLRYLRAHGFGDLSEISYLLKGVKPLVKAAINELCGSDKVVQFKMNDKVYYTYTGAFERLNERLNRQKAKILSPFDNLLIQRKRAQAVFNFDYLLECYLPAAKRQYGYFCLPILWDGKLVARADCKADKHSSTLQVLNLFLESTLRKKEPFFTALEDELSAFAQFNQCDKYQIQRIV
ncbi:winged helix-turn-helix domain-containing protein [Photobacterium minamisatsumaniensis]|uniref:winged helix-turn-helix domain-containing protein n=1 Tax=Photobacterium minamisatsumaniensis TaxID=2910233 RepID=UPI003D1392FC